MTSTPFLDKLDQMVAESRARMTPTQLEAHNAFCRLSFDDMMKTLMGQQVTPPALQATQPISQQKKKRNEKTRQQYKRRTLQQANLKNIAEKVTASSINSTVNTSLLSTTLHQAAKHIDREPTSHGSSGTQFHGNESFRLRFLAKVCHYIMLASPPAYIRYAEEMEATGQG